MRQPAFAPSMFERSWNAPRIVLLLGPSRLAFHLGRMPFQTMYAFYPACRWVRLATSLAELATRAERWVAHTYIGVHGCEAHPVKGLGLICLVGNGSL